MTFMINCKLIFLFIFCFVPLHILIKAETATCELKGHNVNLLLFKSCGIDFIICVNADGSVLYLHKNMLLGCAR